MAKLWYYKCINFYLTYNQKSKRNIEAISTNISKKKNWQNTHMTAYINDSRRLPCPYLLCELVFFHQKPGLSRSQEKDDRLLWALSSKCRAVPMAPGQGMREGRAPCENCHRGRTIEGRAEGESRGDPRESGERSARGDIFSWLVRPLSGFFRKCFLATRDIRQTTFALVRLEFQVLLKESMKRRQKHFINMSQINFRLQRIRLLVFYCS